MPALLLFLKKIPLREWAYVALIAALATALIVFAQHERRVQRDKDQAAQKRVDAAAIVHNVEVEKRAGVMAQQLASAYHTALAAPPAPAPALVCRAAAPVPQHVHQSQGSAAAGPAGNAPAPGGAEDSPAFDPSPAVIRDGADANAQILYLQGYIKTILKALQ